MLLSVTERLVLNLSSGVSVGRYVWWAQEMLLAGYDSPSLRTLASLAESEEVYEGERYFQQCLKELQLTLPEEKEVFIKYAIGVAQGIVEGQRSALDGVKHLYEFSPDDDSDYDVWRSLYWDYEESPWRGFDEVATREAKEFIQEMNKKIAPK